MGAEKHNMVFSVLKPCLSLFIVVLIRQSASYMILTSSIIVGSQIGWRGE